MIGIHECATFLPEISNSSKSGSRSAIAFSSASFLSKNKEARDQMDQLRKINESLVWYHVGELLVASVYYSLPSDAVFPSASLPVSALSLSSSLPPPFYCLNNDGTVSEATKPKIETRTSVLAAVQLRSVAVLLLAVNAPFVPHLSYYDRDQRMGQPT